jgi:hypothetical protein
LKLPISNGTATLFRENPVVIRFKGAVPGWVLTPHIIFMFFAMLAFHPFRHAWHRRKKIAEESTELMDIHPAFALVE